VQPVWFRNGIPTFYVILAVGAFEEGFPAGILFAPRDATICSALGDILSRSIRRQPSSRHHPQPQPRMRGTKKGLHLREPCGRAWRGYFSSEIFFSNSSQKAESGFRQYGPHPLVKIPSTSFRIRFQAGPYS